MDETFNCMKCHEDQTQKVTININQYIGPLVWAATVDKHKYEKAGVFQKIAKKINKAFKDNTVTTTLSNKDFALIIKDAEKDHIKNGSKTVTNNSTGTGTREEERNTFNNATEIDVRTTKRFPPNCKICKKGGKVCQQDRFKRSRVVEGRRIWAGCKECKCSTIHWKTDCEMFQKKTRLRKKGTKHKKQQQT